MPSQSGKVKSKQNNIIANQHQPIGKKETSLQHIKSITDNNNKIYHFVLATCLVIYMELILKGEIAV